MNRAITEVCTCLPATCGELVQGLLDGELCLVSCPIGWYGHVTVRVWEAEEATWTIPPDCVKAGRALRVAVDAVGGGHLSGEVEIHSSVPRGRGYGSSTVDVAGTIWGTVEAVTGRPPDPATVGRLAVRVEPTDSTFVPGLALFAHRTAALLESWGTPPPLVVIVLDPGGEVNTEAFNRAVAIDRLRQLAPLHREAFALLRDGVARQDVEAIGKAATLSAKAHQAVLPSPLVDRALALAEMVRAPGICRAHSGTLVGLLWSASAGHADEVAAWVASRLAGRVRVHLVPLVGGGPRTAHDIREATWCPHW
ncbi:MAG: hypothetical protein Q9O62_07025 [Ardenticatenia bacterium]|nr:hypothetical protein [Ardenticatenia bacterium]